MFSQPPQAMLKGICDHLGLAHKLAIFESAREEFYITGRKNIDLPPEDDWEDGWDWSLYATIKPVTGGLTCTIQFFDTDQKNGLVSALYDASGWATIERIERMAEFIRGFMAECVGPLPKLNIVQAREILNRCICVVDMSCGKGYWKKTHKFWENPWAS